MSRAKLLEDLREAVKLAEELSEITEAYCASVRAASPHILFDVDEMNALLEIDKAAALNRILQR
jgi:hypothetical protein